MLKNKWFKRIVAGLVVCLVLLAAGYWALGFTTVTDGAKAKAPDLGDYQSALSHAHTGGVDYNTLQKDDKRLRRFVAGLAHHGPKTSPKAYPTKAHQLTYYLNAYNALVLVAVLEHLPLESVQDVHGVFEPKAGFGFFYALNFHLDGGRINLYDLENDIIRGFSDPRIHAAINCASRSCPTLSSEAFEADRLDTQLETLFSAFCKAPRHLTVDETEVEASAIFDWFEEDFTANGKPLRKALAECAVPSVRTAIDAGAALRFKKYNWNLNASSRP